MVQITSSKNIKIDRLRSQISLLERGLTRSEKVTVPLGIRSIDDFLTNNGLLLGRIHEVFEESQFQLGNASAIGFVVALLTRILEQTGTTKEILWCSQNESINRGNLSSSGLHWLGFNSHRIIRVNVNSEKDRLWAIEEGLKCSGLIAVVAELDPMHKSLAGKISIVWRRLQLAAEKNSVTGFILLPGAKNINSVNTVSETRWKITPCPTQDWRPKWNLQLLRTRNGRTNSTSVIWDPLTRLFQIPEP